MKYYGLFFLFLIASGCTKEVNINSPDCNVANAPLHGVSLTGVLEVEGKVPACVVKTCDTGYAVSSDKKSCEPTTTDVITYQADFSGYGTCSADEACDGVGLENRTIADCKKFRNGNFEESVNLAFCASVVTPADLQRACDSPAGNKNIDLGTGIKIVSCLAGSTIENFVSISCNSNYHPVAESCQIDVITYQPVYSSYGTCSADEACEGVGTQVRSITQCNQIRNGLPDGTTTLSNCNSFAILANLEQSCQSPAGSVNVAITGGTQVRSCVAGSTTQNFQSVSCDSGYFVNGQICSPDVITYQPVYSSYGTCSALACDGVGLETRTITQCNQLRNGNPDGTTILSNCNSFAIPTNLEQSCPSPAGNVLNPITGGEQTFSCVAGSTTQIFQSVSCDSGYFVDGQICSPDVITYQPVYSSYGSCSADEACEGVGTQVRSITQCNQLRNGNPDGTTDLSNCASFNGSANTVQNCNSPAGTVLNPITGGEQTFSCVAGSSTQTFQSVSCNSGYFIDGQICLPDVITYQEEYSDYGSCSAANVCDGVGIETRTFTCRQYTNGLAGSLVDNSNCSPINLTRSCDSPYGTFTQSTTGGVRTLACNQGSSFQFFVSVSCDFGYFIDGEYCSPDVITYQPMYSSYGTCSALACDGVGLETRTITQCNQLRNGNPDGTTLLSNCDSFAIPANLEQSCPSPAGNIINPITGGEQTFSCTIGSTIQNFESVNCDFGYFIDGQICSPDVITYLPVYSSYGTCSADEACEGDGLEVRSITQCDRYRNGNLDGIALLTDCAAFDIPVNTTQSCQSPAGNVVNPITGGEQTFSCLVGSTIQNFESVSCNFGYFVDGQICSPDVITYDPVYSSYGTCSADEACEGMGIETRTITQCNQLRNGNPDGTTLLSNCDSFAIPANLEQSCQSPAGNIVNPITGGEQTFSCTIGSTAQIFESVSCNFGYFVDGQICSPDVITYDPVYSSYGACSAIACDGVGLETRTITQCNQLRNGNPDGTTSLSNCDSFAIPANLEQSCPSPAGNKIVAITGGEQTVNCAIGSTIENFVSVNCFADYHVNGQICDPDLITYEPVFSAYGTCSADEICDGQGIESRTLTSCEKWRNGSLDSLVANTFCAAYEIPAYLDQACSSPEGDKINPITGGEITVNCLAGSNIENFVSITCFSAFQEPFNQNSCVDIQPQVDGFSINETYPTPSETYTNLVTVSLNTTGATSVQTMQVFENSNCSGAPSVDVAYQDNLPYMILTGDGLKDISIIYRNGLESSSCYNSSITLDTQVPTGTAIFPSSIGVEDEVPEITLTSGDSLSGVDYATISVGTTLGGSDIVAEFNVGSSTTVKPTQLNGQMQGTLIPSTTYYITYKVYDVATNVLTLDAGTFTYVLPPPQLFFGATGVGGQELWMYDGTNAPSRLADIRSGGSSNPSFFAKFKNKVYFAANNNITGEELWHWTGSAATQIFDIFPGTPGSSPREMLVFKGKLYFSAQSSLSNLELWAYDGTTTSVAYELNPTGSSSPKSLFIFNNTLYFSANNGTDGDELWTFDGVNPPTMLVNIHPTGNSLPANFTVYNNQLYFTAEDATFGREIFRYNGGNSVTRITNINTAGNSNPTFLTVYNNKLYFAATSGTSGANTGNELWVYDGTTVSLVMDINTGTANGNPQYLKVYNNKLYFAATTVANGAELWVYDGVNTPSIANEIMTGATSSSPKDLTVFNNSLIYSSFDGATQLWIHDGTNYNKLCTDCNTPAFIFPIY